MPGDDIHPLRKAIVSDAEVRERFRADPDAVLREYGLSDVDGLPEEPDGDFDPRSWLINN